MSHDVQLPEELDFGSLVPTRDALLAAPDGESIILRGASDGVFCRGLALASFADVSPAERDEGLDVFEEIILLLATGCSPTIAALDGVAMGGGLGLAAACDVVVATERARCGLPELLFGIIPGMIFPVLRQRARASALRRMAIEGAAISAEQAERFGLVDEVVPYADLDRRVAAWARKFRRTERAAVGRLKGWIAEADQLPSQVRVGREHLNDLVSSAVAQRRIQAFNDGLAPWEA